MNRQLVYLMVAAALVMRSAPLGTPEAGDCDCKDIRDIRNRICVAKAAISEYDRHIYRLRKEEQSDGTPVMLTPFRKNEGMKPCVAEAMETVRDKSANSADGETTSESCEVTVNAPTPCLEKSIRIHEGVHERKMPIANTKRASDAWLAARGAARHGELQWRPSIYMPHWTSRITLNVVSVEEQWLHDITTNDIIAEGVDVPDVDYTVPDDPRTLDHERDCYAREKFRELWDSINGKRMPWVQNPLVRVIRFEVELTTILREP